MTVQICLCQSGEKPKDRCFSHNAVKIFCHMAELTSFPLISNNDEESYTGSKAVRGQKHCTGSLSILPAHRRHDVLVGASSLDVRAVGQDHDSSDDKYEKNLK